jgi:hypothetical protein
LTITPNGKDSPPEKLDLIFTAASAKDPTPVSGTSPETGPFGATNIARSLNPIAFSHLLVPDLGTLWAETEVSAPVAGSPRIHLAGHIDNKLSIAPRNALDRRA